jgi:uncharacterized protein YcfJ
MNMHTKVMASLFCLGTAALSHAAEFDDIAHVLHVVPQTEQVNQPQQECHTEYVQVQQQQDRSVGGAIIGGIAGGLLGHTVGRGNGNTVATAAGAVTGALVGDRMENNNAGTNVSQQAVQRCHTVDHYITRVSGYAVTYEYQGHEYTSVLPRDPGEKLHLYVSVIPRI